MKYTSRQLFKKISLIYDNSSENSSFRIIKAKNIYYVNLVKYLQDSSMKYTSFCVEKLIQRVHDIETENYQTIIKLSYGHENSISSGMAPVRFISDEVIPPPLIEELIPHLRNFDIDNILNSVVGS